MNKNNFLWMTNLSLMELVIFIGLCFFPAFVTTLSNGFLDSLGIQKSMGLEVGYILIEIFSVGIVGWGISSIITLNKENSGSFSDYKVKKLWACIGISLLISLLYIPFNLSFGMFSIKGILPSWMIWTDSELKINHILFSNLEFAGMRTLANLPGVTFYSLFSLSYFLLNKEGIGILKALSGSARVMVTKLLIFLPIFTLINFFLFYLFGYTKPIITGLRLGITNVFWWFLIISIYSAAKGSQETRLQD